jgi:hypothetical protein
MQPMPDETAADDISLKDSGRWAPTIAVGDRSVLYLTWSGSFEEGYVPSLWVGSVEP